MTTTNRTIVSFVSRVNGLDITQGKRYYTTGPRGEFFKDDAGDERSIGCHTRAGKARDIRYSDGSHDTIIFPAFITDARVRAKRDLFAGDVPSGTCGTVVEPRDPGINVRWDNGFAILGGSATVGADSIELAPEAVVPAEPETTPHDEAQYIIRIVKVSNDLINGSYVVRWQAGSHHFSGQLHCRTGKLDARRFSYPEVLLFLRLQAEAGKDNDFEVILDQVKTGYVKPAPKPTGNNGFKVGDVLRCEISSHPNITARSHYTVTAIDIDGDEIIEVPGYGGELVKYGRSDRNEYTKVGE